MDVEWRDLCVTVAQKHILAPCSGSLGRGRMLALMGPSGSGKTTFLSCLRQDISHSGEVRFGGERFHPGLRQLIGFVEQDDIVLTQLTVRQSLLFLAELRFGVGSAEATSRVESVVAAVRLGRVVDSVVGEAGQCQRISGGERKRLCIARELLGDPQLLICDEPTSGLDSTMAEQVSRSLRSLSDNGSVSVIASIHQPSASIFNAFDDLLLLRQGQVMYFGPLKHAENFFTSHGPSRQPLQSTAEYLMDLLVLDENIKHQSAASTALDCGSGLPASAVTQVLDVMQSQAAALPPLAEPLQTKPSRRRHEAPMLRQLLVLTRRHYFLIVAEVFTSLNVVQNLGLMLIAGLLWVRLGTTDADVFPRWGVCMWTIGTWMFFPLFAGISTFPSVRRVLEKELRVGCYSLPSFYVARTLILLPLDLAWPTIWTTGVFWITNLRSDFCVYVQTAMLVYLTFSAFQGVGLTISASGMPPARSGTTAILLITYFFAWSGFFVSLDRLPVWIRWASDVNPFRFGVELMMQIIMQGEVEFTCENASSAGDGSSAGYGCEWSSSGDLVLSGAAALKRHGITTDPKLCVAVIMVVLIGSRLLAFVLLWVDLRAAINGAGEQRQPTPAPVPTPLSADEEHAASFGGSSGVSPLEDAQGV